MTADHPRTTLSPREAARLTEIGRSSIMRAIAEGTLTARRDNRNQWQITRADLDRWQAARMDRPGPCPADHPEAALELAAVRATVAQLELRLADHVALIAAADDRIRAAEERTRAVEAEGHLRVAAAEAERDRLAEAVADLRRRLDAEAEERRRLVAVLTAPPPRRWWPWPRG